MLFFLGYGRMLYAASAKRARNTQIPLRCPAREQVCDQVADRVADLVFDLSQTGSSYLDMSATWIA